MKVIFKHNHVLGNMGEVKNLSHSKANYLLRCGVVEVVKEKPKEKPKRTPKIKASK